MVKLNNKVVIIELFINYLLNIIIEKQLKILKNLKDQNQ